MMRDIQSPSKRAMRQGKFQLATQAGHTHTHTQTQI